MSRDTDYPEPSTVGSTDGPPVGEKPYKIIFEANRCIGAGRCAAVSDNWELDIQTGLAVPVSFFISEAELEGNVDAADSCPAKKGAGVIHVIDRRTGEEIVPDPHGDGTISVDW
jgi:ferredoxin